MQNLPNSDIKKFDGNDNVSRELQNNNWEAADKKFGVGTGEGHTHDGTAGQGQRINYANLDGKPDSLLHNLATAADQFLVSSGVGAFVVKTVAQIKTLLGLKSTAFTESSDYATAAQGTKADNALAASSYTANDVLTKLKTVDGTGSGLDADLLDGNEASAFIKHSLATAQNDFLIASGAGAFVKKTLAEVKSILGLGSSAYTDSSAYVQKYEILLISDIKGAIQTPTYTNGQITQIVHAVSGVTKRTDTFSYTSTLITETRTLSTGETLTLKYYFNTDGSYNRTEVT